jgi:YHS domain-containing protein
MKQILATLVFIIASTSITKAQQTKFYNSDGIAIKGYDVVAYFTQQQAIVGSDAFTTEWSGSKWKFASKANLDSFKIAPQKYAPQYGGYCAYGCSDNHLAPTDPNAWTIVDNKLYLNYNLKVKGFWIKDTANLIKKADGLWPSLNK